MIRYLRQHSGAHGGFGNYWWDMMIVGAFQLYQSQALISQLQIDAEDETFLRRP